MNSREAVIHRIVPEVPAVVWRALKPLSFPVAERRRKEECYLCGKLPAETPEGKLTKDHLPPQNLFLKPHPPNLIYVRCCSRCNNAASEDDDHLRLAVSGYYNTSELGKRTWKEKVIGSTIRKGRLRQQVKAIGDSLEPIGLITPDGVRDAFELEVERAPMDRILTRMTRGFLALLYPNVDRAELTFRVTQLDQFKVNHPAFAQE